MRSSSKFLVIICALFVKQCTVLPNICTNETSSVHSTAGRTVKTGLTASVIVSQWTWAATLLQSSNVAWQYGVSGPFWYASGATIQVLLFGVLAISLKKVAPSAHTGKHRRKDGISLVLVQLLKSYHTLN